MRRLSAGKHTETVAVVRVFCVPMSRPHPPPNPDGPADVLQLNGVMHRATGSFAATLVARSYGLEPASPSAPLSCGVSCYDSSAPRGVHLLHLPVYIAPRREGGLVRQKKTARPPPAFDGPMVLFQDIIEVLHRAMPAVVHQSTLGFELHNGWWITGVLVDIDYAWRGMVLSAQGFRQKALSRCLRSCSKNRWPRRQPNHENSMTAEVRRF